MPRSNHYQARVNRALDYIAGHLDGELSLARLSAVGCFSPFHFHWIFQGVSSETLNGHVRRVRLERAASLLKASPKKRITDVALETGFAGTAEFSRAFKSHFGTTASGWDRRTPLENSKIRKAPESIPFHTIEELQRWKKDARFRVLRLNPFGYVYSRIFAAHGSKSLVDNYQALIHWLTERSTDLRDPTKSAMIWGLRSASSRAASSKKSCAHAGRSDNQWYPRKRNAKRGALLSATSDPARLSPSTASEILHTSVARGSICIVCGFRPASTNRRICQQWRCSLSCQRR